MKPDNLNGFDLTVAVEGAGFAVVPSVAGVAVGELMADVDALAGAEAVRRREGRAYAVRDLLRLSPAVRRLADSPAMHSLAASALGPRATAVRGLLFDKTPGANWKVAWHQDVTIAVAERHDVDGFGPWSVKSGVPHVRPPAGVLARMITLRLHLDDCPADNGALRVLPGSHSQGLLDDHAIARWRDTVTPVVCEVPAGGVLLMRPLLLHASSASAPSAEVRHRRVVHLEYAADPLPGGLRWHEV